jgi:Zn-dependent M28 family amino/carboxypeptidase
MHLVLLLACAHGAPVAGPPVAAPPPPTPPAVAPVATTTGGTEGNGAGTTGAAAELALPAEPHVAALLAAARRDDRAMLRLSELCDGIGARPAGSDAYEKAARWAADTLRADGHVNVALEDAPSDVWIRGAERLRMLAPVEREMAMLGLGNSVGTPGVEAPVVVLHSFNELGPQVKGKIVLFDSPMSDALPAHIQYGTNVQYRVNGASRAASFGAVATLVRSVTARSLYTPHTGAMHYEDGAPRIPTASITAEDADRIDRLTARGVEVRVRLEMGATTGPTVVTHNVLGEIRGSTHPDEIVLVGAHLDSWDVGSGAQDDGAGVVEVMEAMRLIREHGTPARTIRAVLFSNEERGLSGAKAYDAAHGKENHVAAIETDLGGGRPLGWVADGTEQGLAWLHTAAAPAGLPVSDGDGGGADISPLRDRGVVVVGLVPDDSHYFDIHHTNADTVDKVDPAALQEATGRLAALTWQLANADGAPSAPAGPAIARP